MMIKKNVLIFSPHPDDETIACGGTIALLAQAGHNVHIVFMTDGSQSHQAVLNISVEPSPEELAVIRKQEARNAAGTLGVNLTNVHFVGIEDTQLHARETYARTFIRQLILDFNADEIYIPHEILELHSDHRLTGEWVLEELSAVRKRPEVFKYVVWDERTEAEFSFSSRVDSDRIKNPNEVEIENDISSVKDIKLASFAKHQTQTTLFSKHQDRPVVPITFQRRLQASDSENFWTHQFKEPQL